MTTYQRILQMREQMADIEERAAADERLRHYRRDELYRNLRRCGLSLGTAEQISEAVWEVPTPWIMKSSHRNPFQLVGVK